MHQFFFIMLFATLFAANASAQQDSCDIIREELAFIKVFVKKPVFVNAVNNIRDAADLDSAEHCIAFGQDSLQHYAVSNMTNGNNTSGKVPSINNCFADLHNHINNLPPDAVDVYGLIKLCKRNTLHNKRFLVTSNRIIYVFFICNRDAAIAFADRFPARQPPVLGFQPTFPERIVDECRRMKYQDELEDDLILIHIIKLYNTGIVLKKIEY